MGTKLGKKEGTRWVMLYGECTVDVCRYEARHATRCYYCKQTYYKCIVDDCNCDEEDRTYYENYSSSDSDSDSDYDSDPDYDYDSDSDSDYEDSDHEDSDPDSDYEDSDYEDVDYNK